MPGPSQLPGRAPGGVPPTGSSAMDHLAPQRKTRSIRKTSEEQRPDRWPERADPMPSSRLRGAPQRTPERSAAVTPGSSGFSVPPEVNPMPLGSMSPFRSPSQCGAADAAAGSAMAETAVPPGPVPAAVAVPERASGKDLGNSERAPGPGFACADPGDRGCVVDSVDHASACECVGRRTAVQPQGSATSEQVVARRAVRGAS